MEWNSKLPSWDFSSLEQNAELNMGALAGLSCGPGSQGSGMDCSVDLKLGNLGDFRPPEKWKSLPTMSTTTTTTVSSSGPPRRARAPGNAGQIASCLVDGCKSDLSNSREYHRRHKVCEVHSKTPVVMVGGQKQRFCQQCSRFHQLEEFDEVKRSCRKRLDGHNRRRRKPQPESTNPGGSLFPNHQGSGFLMYTHIIPTPIQNHNCAGIIKTEDTAHTNKFPLHVIDSQQHFSGSFCSNKDVKQFPFLQDDNTAFSRTIMGKSTCQQLLKTISSEESSSGKILSDEMTQVLNSDCALSLLSPNQNPSVDMGQMLPAARIPLHQSLVSSLPYNSLDQYCSQASSYVSPTGFSYSGVEDEQVGTVFVCNTDASLHCQSVFHIAGEGNSAEASQALPSPWR